jgi:DNA modification methylase
MSDVTLYCGECAEVMAREIADNSIDLTVTSPPYDNLRTYKGYTFDFAAIAAQLWRVTKPGGVVVWVVADATINGSETGTSFRQALRFMEIGFRLYDTMIWYKINPAIPTEGRYMDAHEFMFVLSKGKPTTLNLLDDRINRKAGQVDYKDTVINKGNAQTTNRKFEIGPYGRRFNVWPLQTGNNGQEIVGHVGPFPEALARDHIASWSNPGDVVLDPFVGSGTTGKMAVRAGRRFIGIDIAAEYVALARERIGRTQLQPALFAHDAPRAVQSAMFDGGD